MSVRLTEHHFAKRGEQLPPVDETLMLDYVTAAGGLYARGRRKGMEVCMPIASASVRGLKAVEPYLQWGYLKVPAGMLGVMLSISRHAAKDAPMETLFHLTFDLGPHSHGHLFCHGGWHLEYPEQRQHKDYVELIHKGSGTSEERAVIEVHSHHYSDAYFSPEDDEDEGGLSFRVYAVLGKIFTRPTIKMRVGLFGHFMEWPAAEIFELPENLTNG